MASNYNKKQWKEFRDRVIELDSYKCAICGRDQSEVVLQVHHKKYINDRKPWEYIYSDCITLCKGCHAAEHGIIMPKVGWRYIGEDDLGGLDGICENCGTPIRYVFLVYHENWGTIEVGTLCCDNLTDSQIASNQIESLKRYESRKARFLKSKRWKIEGDLFKIKHLFDIEIEKIALGFYLKIHNRKSRTIFKSLDEAKSTAFEVIESEILINYFKEKNIPFDHSKFQKNKKKG